MILSWSVSTESQYGGIYVVGSAGFRRRVKEYARRLSNAAAAANLFTHALNPLAHPNDGLAAAAKIVTSLACAELKTAGLDDTCELIREFLRTDVTDAR